MSQFRSILLAACSKRPEQQTAFTFRKNKHCNIFRTDVGFSWWVPIASSTQQYLQIHEHSYTHTHNCQTFTRWPSPPVLIKEDGIRSALQRWNLYSWVHYMTGTSSMQQNHYMIYPALTFVEHSLLSTSQKLTHSPKKKSHLHHPKLSTTKQKAKEFIYKKTHHEAAPTTQQQQNENMLTGLYS